jgi:hypothetical protein
MASAHTLNDVIRVSEAYAAFEENPTEVSMEDLEFVMGGSLEGLLRHIPGVGEAIDIAKEVPGAVEEVREWAHDTFPSDAEIQHSQAEGEASAHSAQVASDQATAYASAAAEQAQLAHGVY